MKKTNEQIKKEIVSYLTKTSQHTFITPNGSYFKVIKEGDSFMKYEGDNLSPIGIDNMIRYYEDNSKCVLKHRLFLDKKMLAVKNKSIDEILKK